MADKEETRQSENKSAKLVRISPTYWVHKDDREKALDDVRRVMGKHQRRAKKILEKHRKENPK